MPYLTIKEENGVYIGRRLAAHWHDLYYGRGRCGRSGHSAIPVIYLDCYKDFRYVEPIFYTLTQYKNTKSIIDDKNNILKAIEYKDITNLKFHNIMQYLNQFIIININKISVSKLILQEFEEIPFYEVGVSTHERRGELDRCWFLGYENDVLSLQGDYWVHLQPLLGKPLKKRI